MRDFAAYSAAEARRLLWDISGAFGDIGVLFPLAIALIAANGFDPTALFLAAGLFYVTSALYFRVTMPVQPLKAMAAIAIASGLSVGMINTAGIMMGAILLLFALTGLSAFIGRLFPVAVVRGIQLGLGLLLIKASAGFIFSELHIAAISAGMLAAALLFFRQVPPMIPLLVTGIGIVIFRTDALSAEVTNLSIVIPDINSLWPAFVLLVVPQLALTMGNAVVATEATAKMLYGEKAQRLNMRSIPLSMGIANIFSGLAGGAPMCHGSGGLTAHNKFGARDARSGLVIGLVLISTALIFGSSVMPLLKAFPAGILGVLLCYVGIQHSLFIRDILDDRVSVAVAVATAVTGAASGNLTAGFAAGLAIYYVHKAYRRVLISLKNDGLKGNGYVR